uniref:Putative secreted protein n=1 Tax=Ixodes ricinus TaxID=34613 RepID=A0A6B0URC2_IXORI
MARVLDWLGWLVSSAALGLMVERKGDQVITLSVPTARRKWGHTTKNWKSIAAADAISNALSFLFFFWTSSQIMKVNANTSLHTHRKSCEISLLIIIFSYLQFWCATSILLLDYSRKNYEVACLINLMFFS